MLPAASGQEAPSAADSLPHGAAPTTKDHPVRMAAAPPLGTLVLGRERAVRGDASGRSFERVGGQKRLSKEGREE